LPPVKTISAIKAKEIARVKGLREYAFAKEVFAPKRLERIGVGILKEKMIVKYPKYEKVYAQYYAEEIGGKIVKAFEKPPITVKKMLVSKKAQLMLRPPIKAPKPKGIRPPLVPPIGELAKRVAVAVHIGKPKPLIVPIPIIPKAPKRIMKPITRIIPTTRITPITRVKPIVTPKIVPIIKVTPITKVKPIIKIEPIMKVTPITKITPIAKVTPVVKITPITKITPIVTPIITPILKVTPITKITPIAKVTPIGIVPPPPLVPPPIIPPITRPRRIKKKKKKKRILRRPTRYRPSLVAVKRMIKAKPPRRLTGLEIRPIPI